jgi:hypothetical protein
MNSGSMEYYFQPAIGAGWNPGTAVPESARGTGYNVPLPIDPLTNDPMLTMQAIDGGIGGRAASAVDSEA